MLKKELSYLLKHAKKGDVKAQLKVADEFRFSQQFVNAYDWYLKAADAGNASAQHNIGQMCLKGQGVRKNKKRAFKWFLKSAEKNHEPSYLNLAIAYIRGFGVRVDLEKGLYWLRKYEQKFLANDIYKLLTPSHFYKKVIDNRFKQISKNFYIDGGWAYNKDTAVIVKEMPSKDEYEPFDSLLTRELDFIRRRNYEEFHIMKPKYHKYYDLGFNVLTLEQVNISCKSFDKYTVEVTGIHELAWSYLQNIKNKQPTFRTGTCQYEQKYLLSTERFIREFWFDVSTHYS